MTLKSKNFPIILVFIAISYIAFAYANDLPWSFFKSVEVTNKGVVFENPVFGLAFHLLGLVLVFLLPANLKHIIVFMRKSHPLPGCRVFTDLLQKDHRISKDELISMYGELPTEPKEQNSLWYKIYKTKIDDNVIQSSHRTFLLFRDLLSISLIIYPVGIIVSAIIEINIKTITFASIAILVTICLWVAARNAGERFACNVIAR